jgi:hypothetical protein
MGKCSPIAAKILSTWERATTGRDVPAADFLEFFPWGAYPPTLRRSFAKFNLIAGCWLSLASSRAGRSRGPLCQKVTDQRFAKVRWAWGLFVSLLEITEM